VEDNNVRNLLTLGISLLALMSYLGFVHINHYLDNPKATVGQPWSPIEKAELPVRPVAKDNCCRPGECNFYLTGRNDHISAAVTDTKPGAKHDSTWFTIEVDQKKGGIKPFDHARNYDLTAAVGCLIPGHDDYGRPAMVGWAELLHETVQVAGPPTTQNEDIPPICLGFLNQSRQIDGPVGRRQTYSDVPSKWWTANSAGIQPMPLA
jgi:hypothetical protein